MWAIADMWTPPMPTRWTRCGIVFARSFSCVIVVIRYAAISISIAGDAVGGVRARQRAHRL